MGGATNIPQFRFANNWQYQDTMSFVRGRHTFRFGLDYLRQLARQHPPFNERGSFAYAPSAGGVSAFSNFLDDFGGNGGSLNRQFGTSIYHPNLFRQSYFFQDSWKTTQNLTLNLGLRYENFGMPVNTFAVAAFTDYDAVNFAAPRKVDSDNNNFAPSVGFALNPKGTNQFDRMMGGSKMVWRGGFQVSYDTWFNKLLRSIDMNPLVNGVRFQPQVGIRTVRATSANSNYESFQLDLKRRFSSTPAGRVQFEGSYTYSHFLDDVSDVFGFDSTPSSLQSVSQVVGGSRHLDYGNSDFDRRNWGRTPLAWD